MNTIDVYSSVWVDVLGRFPWGFGKFFIVKYVNNVKYKSAQNIHPEKSKDKEFVNQKKEFKKYTSKINSN